MEEKIKEILSEVSGVPLAELREDTRLVGDLGMSSLIWPIRSSAWRRATA